MSSREKPRFVLYAKKKKRRSDGTTAQFGMLFAVRLLHACCIFLKNLLAKLVYIDIFFFQNESQIALSFQPVHEVSNNVVCATSKVSDQAAHTRSLIRAFASRLSIL